MNRWLARLAFSFLILAGLLLWQGYRELTMFAHPSTGRIALYFIAAGISIGLAFRGIRERHRGGE
ncbi:MAG TPA: hypothetical protein VH475_27980 [Tepidisphaeraceae bacterium]|jgi:hypothetical protein